MPPPEWSTAQAVDGEWVGRTSERSLHWQRNGTCRATFWELALGAFRGVWLSFTKNETEQLRTKLSMAEDIDYLRGAAIPLGRKGNEGRRAVRNWDMGCNC